VWRFLCGTDWILKYYLDELAALKKKHISAFIINIFAVIVSIIIRLQTNFVDRVYLWISYDSQHKQRSFP
jgi:hypothetical protein